jgi:Rrf2 family protein
VREGDPPRPVKGDHVATAQAIPIKFLENILLDLRQAGLVNSRRGPEGGYWLSRAPEEITVADVIRAADGPLASVRGEKPEDLRYQGSAEPLASVWIALRSSLREVLEQVTLADLAAGELPAAITGRTDDPGAWTRR